MNPSLRTPYVGTRPINLLEETPLDLAPRRLIAPRRRLRGELSTNTVYNASQSLITEILEVVNRVHSIDSDADQPESPSVNN